MRKSILITLVLFLLLAWLYGAFGQEVSGVDLPSSVSSIDEPTSVSGVDLIYGGFTNTYYLDLSDANDDYVNSNVADGSFDLTQYDATIGWWCRPDQSAATIGTYMPMHIHNESTSNMFLSSLDNSPADNVQLITNNTSEFNLDADVAVDTWYFMVLVIDYKGTETDTEVSLYVNGDLIGSGTFVYTKLGHNNATQIGWGRTSYRTFDGDVDEWFIYKDHAMSETTIDSIWNSATSPTGMRSIENYYYSKCVDWVRFEEGTGTNVAGEKGVITAGTIKTSDNWQSH